MSESEARDESGAAKGDADAANERLAAKPEALPAEDDGASLTGTEGSSAADVESASAPGDRAPKKKKKKKRKQESSETGEPVQELDADGRERPRFLLDFPRDPALDRLAKAFELGNYALVRAEAPAVAEKSEDQRVRDAASELLRRIEPDPLVKVLLALSVLLLLVITVWAFRTHGN